MKKIILLFLLLFLPINVNATFDTEPKNKLDYYIEIVLDMPFYYDRALKEINKLEDETLKEKYLYKLESIYQKVLLKEKRLNEKNIKRNLIFFLVSLLLLLFVYFKYNKVKKIKIEKNFIPQYNPATISYLMKKKISDDALIGEILIVFYKEILLIEENTIIKNKNYRNPLSEIEKQVIKVFLDEKDSIDISTFQNNSIKLYSMFLAKIEYLKELLMNEVLKEHFFEYDLGWIHKNLKSYHYYKIIILFFLVSSICIVFHQAMVTLFSIFLFPVLIGFVFARLDKTTIKKTPVLLQIIEICFSILILFSAFSYYLIKYNYYSSSFYINILFVIVAILCIAYCERVKKRSENGVIAYRLWQEYQNEFRKINQIDNSFLDYFIYSFSFSLQKKVLNLYLEDKVKDKNDSVKVMKMLPIYECFDNVLKITKKNKQNNVYNYKVGRK